MIHRRPVAGQVSARNPLISRRSALAGLAAAFLAPAAARADSFWGRRLPDPPAAFVFGYGSLMDAGSRAGTAGAALAGLPVRAAPEFGYVRGWVQRGASGFTALGLRRPRAGEAPSSVNGVAFPVTEDQLARFDRRERGYRRVAIPPEQVEAAGWQRLPEGATVWVYVTEPLEGAGLRDVMPPDAAFPIVQSYVDLVLAAALDYGTDFAREVVATTADWSPYWLDDRPVARRPWTLTPKAGAIDSILEETEPAASLLAERLVSEPYAARRLVPGAGAPAR